MKTQAIHTKIRTLQIAEHCKKAMCWANPFDTPSLNRLNISFHRGSAIFYGTAY